MNDVYFACQNCQLYIDAGYRWTQNLSAAIQRGQKVDMDAVFSAVEYWRGVGGDQYLQNLLQQVRVFLEAHREHDVIFGWEEDFHHFDAASLGWMEVEIDAKNRDESGTEYFWGPRDFVEKLGYTHWEQVLGHIAKLEWSVWWFEEMELRIEGRRRFEWFARNSQ